MNFSISFFRLSICFFTALTLIACQPETQEQTTHQLTEAPQAPTRVETPIVEGDSFPVLPVKVFESLIQNLDRTDIVFYTSGLSAGGQGENARALLRFVVGKPVVIPKSCYASGRIDFYQQGNTLATAEFYAAEDCRYFVFNHNDQKYGSEMNAEGQTFFLNMEQGH